MANFAAQLRERGVGHLSHALGRSRPGRWREHRCESSRAQVGPVDFPIAGSAAALHLRREVRRFDVAVGLDDDHPVRFAIAGEDRRFVWADARIDGEQVIVWSDEVPNPVAIRYAWADNPEGANLYNAEDLPASPFRTDDW